MAEARLRPGRCGLTRRFLGRTTVPTPDVQFDPNPPKAAAYPARCSFVPHCSHTNVDWLSGTACTCWQL